MRHIAIVWLLYDCGSPQDLVQVCKSYGFEEVAIKVLDGEAKYNVQYGEKKLIEYLEVLRANDIEVSAWGYHYTDRPGPQGDAIGERREKLKFVRYYLNVEKEFKAPGGGNAFVTMADKLKIGGFEVLVCSYRFPAAHTEMPWERMNNHEAVDGWAPQVYWALSHDPVYQLEKSLAQYDAFSDKPCEPMGPLFGQTFKIKQPDGTYKDVYWEPTPVELIAFRQRAQALGLNISYFRLDWAIKRKRWDLVEAATGFHSTPPPPPPPPVIPEKIRIRGLTGDDKLNVRLDVAPGEVVFFTGNGKEYYVNGVKYDATGRAWYSIWLSSVASSPALYVSSLYTEPVE